MEAKGNGKKGLLGFAVLLGGDWQRRIPSLFISSNTHCADFFMTTGRTKKPRPLLHLKTIQLFSEEINHDECSVELSVKETDTKPGGTVRDDVGRKELIHPPKVPKSSKGTFSPCLNMRDCMSYHATMKRQEKS